MESIRFQKIGDIPLPSDGYSLVAKSVASDGSLLFLFVEPTGTVMVTEMTYRQGIFTAIFPKTKMKESKRFRLCIARTAEPAQIIDLPELDPTFPKVDVFPNGKILIVSPRCSWRGEGDVDLNGIIFDPKTASLSRILLGDGIGSVYVDAVGRIWVAYFDEGIFGNFGWGNSGPAPVGAAGLVCFSEAGEKIWEYPADDASGMIHDCCALNVSGSNAAICFDAEFPICRISNDFGRAYWKADLSGCYEFAISDTKVLFSGQSGDPPDAAYLGWLEVGKPIAAQQVRLLLPDGSGIPEGQLLGRGRHLYFFDAFSAYRASLD